MRPLLLRVTALLTGLASLCSCSGSDLLNLTVPRSGYAVHRDIAYGDDPRQKLDVYVPEDAAPDAPVILFFYGGSWQFGSKGDYRFLGQAFASKGFITVVADYRLYPQATFPAFVVDGGRALAWTHSHIAEYGGDAGRVFVAGHSAGGFNAAMLTLNEQYLTEAGAKRAWIRGMIGIAGPYDFRPLTDPDIIAVFNGQRNDPATQPITFAHGSLPPFFLATGAHDDTVLPKNTHNLAAKLRANGTPVVMKDYEGVKHIGIILSLANGFRGRSPLLEDIAQFVRETSAK